MIYIEVWTTQLKNKKNSMYNFLYFANHVQNTRTIHDSAFHRLKFVDRHGAKKKKKIQDQKWSVIQYYNTYKYINSETNHVWLINWFN